MSNSKPGCRVSALHLFVKQIPPMASGIELIQMSVVQCLELLSSRLIRVSLLKSEWGLAFSSNLRAPEATIYTSIVCCWKAITLAEREKRCLWDFSNKPSLYSTQTSGKSLTNRKLSTQIDLASINQRVSKGVYFCRAPTWARRAWGAQLVGGDESSSWAISNSRKEHLARFDQSLLGSKAKCTSWNTCDSDTFEETGTTMLLTKSIRINLIKNIRNYC